MSEKMRGDLKEKKVKQSLGEPCWEKEYKLSLIDVSVQRAEKWQNRKPPWECSERFGSPATRHNGSGKANASSHRLPNTPWVTWTPAEGPEKTGTAARFDPQGLTSRRASRSSSSRRVQLRAGPAYNQDKLTLYHWHEWQPGLTITPTASVELPLGLRCASLDCGRKLENRTFNLLTTGWLRPQKTRRQNRQQCERLRRAGAMDVAAPTSRRRKVPTLTCSHCVSIYTYIHHRFCATFFLLPLTTFRLRLCRAAAARCETAYVTHRFGSASPHGYEPTHTHTQKKPHLTHSYSALCHVKHTEWNVWSEHRQ